MALVTAIRLDHYSHGPRTMFGTPALIYVQMRTRHCKGSVLKHGLSIAMVDQVCLAIPTMQ